MFHTFLNSFALFYPPLFPSFPPRKKKKCQDLLRTRCTHKDAQITRIASILFLVVTPCERVRRYHRFQGIYFLHRLSQTKGPHCVTTHNTDVLTAVRSSDLTNSITLISLELQSVTPPLFIQLTFLCKQ